MRKQELMFAILKQLAIQEIDIIGEGVVEVKAAPGKSA
jgi:transcription termination factor Rho